MKLWNAYNKDFYEIAAHTRDFSCEKAYASDKIILSDLRSKKYIALVR